MTFKCFSLTSGIVRSWFGPISLVGLQASFKPIELSSHRVSREVASCLVEDDDQHRVFPLSLFFCSSQLLRLSPQKLQVDDLISPPPSVTSSLKPLSPHVHQMWPPLPAEVLCHISQQSVLQQIQLVLFLYFSFFSCFVANVQKQRMHHQMRCKYNLMEYECYQAQQTLQKCSEPPRIKKVFEFQLLLYYYYY